jgi:hypothetical protein
MGVRLALAVFALVTLGTVGVVAFANRGLSVGAPGGDDRLTMAIVAAIVVGLVILGYWQSRHYMSAAQSRRVLMATGAAAVHGDDHVRIGPTPLRLPGEEQRGAFTPGSDYRVYYLAGPVPIVLSAEAVGAGPAPDGEEPEASVADETAVFRRGYVVVVMLGMLAVGIPVAGIAAGRLSGGLQSMVWIGLLGLAVAFAWFAVRWPGGAGSPVRPGGRRRGRGPAR